HPGQGTSNRRVFLLNGMIEFLWIHDEREAASAATARTRLLDRSRYPKSGFSPFGICVCSSIPEPFAGWPYRPGYMPAGIELWMAENELQPWEPAVFRLSGVQPPSAARSTQEPVLHPNGARAIRRISVTLEGAPAS